MFIYDTIMKYLLTDKDGEGCPHIMSSSKSMSSRCFEPLEPYRNWVNLEGKMSGFAGSSLLKYSPMYLL